LERACLSLILACWLFCTFAFGTVPAFAETQVENNVIQDTPDNQSYTGSVEPVSPKEFTDKMNKFVGEINNMLAGIIVPLAMLGMLISTAILALGGVIGTKTVQRFGWGGLLMSVAGLLIFWGIPVIIGLTKSLAGYFAG